MKPSIKTIAEQAGVSKTTVSFVLNGRGDEKNISAETQKRIFDIAKHLNYQPNQLARSLSMGRSFTIGFIVPDISNPFFGKIARLVERFAEEKGYSVMVASTDESARKEQQVLETFRNRQIDGVIIAPVSDLAVAGNITSMPMVSFDRIFQQQTDSFVDIDNKATAKILCEQLIQKEHRSIGLLSLTSYLPNIKSRIEGYKEALAAHAIDYDENLVIEIDAKHKKDSVQAALKKLLNGSNPVSAVLFLNNVIAAEGIWTINKYYPQLINQLQFACFDNLDVFDYALPKTTSALQPGEAIAQNCVHMLFNQIENKMLSKGLCLSTKIIER